MAQFWALGETDEGAVAFQQDVVIVGGCGRVGLPLGLAFADRGLKVVLYDVNEASVGAVASGHMPFREEGALPVLERVLATTLTVTSSPEAVASAESVVVVVGTPVDEHLNPDPTVVTSVVHGLRDQLCDGHLLVLRSTLFPGTTALVERQVAEWGTEVDVSFCPERIAEGKAMTELFELPQIVSGRSESALARAEKLFSSLTSHTVRLAPEEAELAKLFTNTWRYIKFATANQLFMMATDFGLDYEKIRSALAFDYPRAADLPGAGFAAGPCLLKDTMQLAAFNNNNFVLGHAAMMVNEGLPLYLVSRLEQKYELGTMAVGILGMSFKDGSDDIRSSLSYKLRRILRYKARSVLCADPYVTTDDSLRPMEEVVRDSDLLIVAAPHREYRNLRENWSLKNSAVPIVDIWGLNGDGGLQ